MSTKSADLDRVVEARQARKAAAYGQRSVSRANQWLYFILALLVLVCLAFAAIVWSILLSPLN